ncbi:hypothetical protein V5799_013392 [Amblyomma americanum]|uniref:BACK domain-containing protein n=1 Tax=Amblyomma americanum TaxID=6943 RepID=A0AAQ4E630_AMBAM
MNAIRASARIAQRVFEKEPLERSLPAWIAAKKLNMPDEEKQLFRFITHNFEDIAKTDSFYELDATQLKEILRADVIRAEEYVVARPFRRL